MNTVILGAGATGLAAGIASGGTVYEALDLPGGLCHDYQKNGFVFSKGGGHFLFGAEKNPAIAGYIQTLTPCKRYERKASVYFPEHPEFGFYEYPIQADPRYRNIIERETAGEYGLEAVTMKDALRKQFGAKACEDFFFPFNDAYTAGLYDKVAPQDAYKSPTAGKGYNVSFLYPKEGLGVLAQKMAAKCNIRFNKRVVRIDYEGKAILCEDGTVTLYDKLISTLPLNMVMAMTSLFDHPKVGKPDPHVSVLVTNIGAARGSKCPNDHWVYVPSSESGFHRVGFYSNIDPMFAPEGKVAIYVETAVIDKHPPFDGDPYFKWVIDELQGWGWIDEVEVADPTFVDVAYTYRWPNSTWRENSLALLKQHDIHSVGRFGAWKFQGIMESIKEGFEAGCQT